MVEKDNDSQERDYLLTGSPDIVKPLTTHLIATLERFEELEQKVDYLIDLFAELRSRRNTGQVKNYPKITLYFEELKEDRDPRFSYPVHAQVSFRWMKFTVERVRNDEQALKQMGALIKSKFAKPIFYFDKGKKIGKYHNPAQGFNYVWGEFKDEANARKLFEQTLDLQGKTPQWEDLIISGSTQPTMAYPDKPKKVMVLGESVSEGRKRPLGRVYFKYAFIILPPRKKPIYLCDVSGKKDSLV